MQSKYANRIMFDFYLGLPHIQKCSGRYNIVSNTTSLATLWGTNIDQGEIFHLHMGAHVGCYGYTTMDDNNSLTDRMNCIVWITKRLFRHIWIGATQAAVRHSMSLGLPWYCGKDVLHSPTTSSSFKKTFRLNLLYRNLRMILQGCATGRAWVISYSHSQTM